MIKNKVRDKGIFKECPRFDSCSVNNCPLSQLYPDLILCEDDKETICTMEKQVRFRIGSKYSDLLKYQGLTAREFSAKKRYENMTDIEKEILAERGRQSLLNIKKSDKV